MQVKCAEYRTRNTKTNEDLQYAEITVTSQPKAEKMAPPKVG